MTSSLPFFQIKMTVTDNLSPYERGLAEFFGDPALAERFGKLSKVEEKLEMMWRGPMIQVCY